MTGDNELMQALEPFAKLADVILSEAPAEADDIVLFTDCQRQPHAISMDQLRAASVALASSSPAEPVAFAYGPQGDPPTWFASTRWKASDIGKWTETPLYAAPVPPPAGDASWTDSEIARRAQRIVEIANKYEGYDELALAKVPVTVLRAAAMIVNGKAFEPLVEKMRDTAGDAELREALAAMLEMYGPPAAVAGMCEYPADHPISKARKALLREELPNV